MTSPRAAVLAIGTELTTGQITNRNAAWISQRLVNLGIEVALHETVPDDRPLMRGALERCAREAELVFVTGGLGPTTDDFTREAVAEWAGAELVYDEASWKMIDERLTRFGVPRVPSQRQQAYFPAGARILSNSEGTANAFALEKGNAKAWVFPGPPRELAAVWERHVEPELRALFPSLTKLKLFTWDCLGKSEGELGEITEAAIKGSRLKTGYREHTPYIEIKIWCLEEDLASQKPWIDRLEAAIRPWVISRQGEDIAKTFLGRIAATDEVELIDAASHGFLIERLAPLLRSPERRSQAEDIDIITEWAQPADPAAWIRDVLERADEDVLTLSLAGITPEGKWALGMKSGGFSRVEELEVPFRAAPLRERVRQAVVELAFKSWREWLESQMH